MPSMDFVVDLCEQIKKQGIQFIFIGFHTDKKTGNVISHDVSNIKNKKAAKILLALIEDLQQDIVKEVED